MDWKWLGALALFLLIVIILYRASQLFARVVHLRREKKAINRELTRKLSVFVIIGIVEFLALVIVVSGLLRHR